MINEATLEARVNSALVSLFPLLGPQHIVHQRVLPVTVGHLSAQLDGYAPYKKYGRLDVLLEIDGRPLALLELKAPGTALTSSDARQALSYARLLNRMPPLAIVSNGSQHKYYTVWDGEPWQEQTATATVLRGLLETSFEAAHHDLDSAIATLLAIDDGVLGQAFALVSRNTLNHLSGPVHDYTRPLVNGFVIHRRLAHRIKADICREVTIGAVLGPPLSGKTNVLSQVYFHLTRAKVLPLFVDATMATEGLFQYLSNLFTRDIFRSATPQSSRHWLYTILHQQRSIRAALLVDGLSPEGTRLFVSELLELINWSEAGPLSLILAMDDTAFESLSRVAGRPTMTLLGQKSRQYHVPRLTDQEFEEARNRLTKKLDTHLPQGSHLNADYYVPRFLRVVAATCQSSEPQSQTQPTISSARVLAAAPTVTTAHLLRGCWEAFIPSTDLRLSLMAIAKTFAAERDRRNSDLCFKTIAAFRGIVTFEGLRESMGDEQLRLLRSQGHVSLVSGPNDLAVIVPKLPEALAVAASVVLADDAYSNAVDLEDVYRRLITVSADFPYPDIVGAMAIETLARRNTDASVALVRRLVAERPRPRVIEAGTALTLGIPGVRAEPLSIVTDGPSVMIGNLHPWLVLSQLSCIMGFGQADGFSPMVEVFSTLGSCEDGLRRPDDIPFAATHPLRVHETPNGRQMLCSCCGILEPVVIGMQAAMEYMPDDMVDLARVARLQANVPLANRLGAAAFALLRSTDPTLAATAQMVMQEITGVAPFGNQPNR